jgi:Kef-type K+ transport system membrane component KefB
MHMPIETLFMTLALVWLCAGLLGAVVARLGVPSVIGELAAGVILGPSLLGWVAPAPTLQALAEIGVVLLLFEVGMDTELTRLKRSGSQAVAVAMTGFFLPFSLGFVCAHWMFGLPLATSLFVGGTLTATSIGITVRVFKDLGRDTATEGQVVLGAAVLDDVLGVITLAVLSQFGSSGEVSAAAVGRIIFFVLAFVFLAPLAAKLATGVISALSRRHEAPALLLILVVSTVLAFSALAHALGAPVILGGFAAGLALGRGFHVHVPEGLRLPFGAALRRLLAADPAFTHQVETHTRPLVHLFAPLFFVLVGVSLNLRSVNWADPHVAALLASLVVVAIVGKWASGFVLKLPRLQQHAVGLAMIPRGEVGLIFIQLGVGQELLDPTVSAALLATVAITTFLPPFALQALYRWAPASSKGTECVRVEAGSQSVTLMPSPILVSISTSPW